MQTFYEHSYIQNFVLLIYFLNCQNSFRFYETKEVIPDKALKEKICLSNYYLYLIQQVGVSCERVTNSFELVTVSSKQAVKSFERVDVSSEQVTKSFERVGVLSKRVTKSFERMTIFLDSVQMVVNGILLKNGKSLDYVFPFMVTYLEKIQDMGLYRKQRANQIIRNSTSSVWYFNNKNINHIKILKRCYQLIQKPNSAQSLQGKLNSIQAGLFLVLMYVGRGGGKSPTPPPNRNILISKCTW